MIVDLNPKIFEENVEKIATRKGYGLGVLDLAKEDDRVVVLTADLAESTAVLEFKKNFPGRFIECGVAEQNMMGVAAGLALYGKIPFLTSYATFSPGRNWDQLRVSVCYSQANVKIVGAHTGVSVGPDGATHQALEDIAITRVLPGITVVVPCDSLQARKATIALGRKTGPAYLRLTRSDTPTITKTESEFVLGKAQVLKDGTDVAIFASGPLVFEALWAAKILEDQGVSAAVINNHTIKPLDSETLLHFAKRCKSLVTVEEHQKLGGMGSSICEFLSGSFPIPVEIVGMPDTFGESGKPEELIKKYQMDREAILKAVMQVIKRKK